LLSLFSPFSLAQLTIDAKFKVVGLMPILASNLTLDYKKGRIIVSSRWL